MTHRSPPYVLSGTKIIFSLRLLLDHLPPPHPYVANGASSRGVLPLRTTLLAVLSKVNERGKCGHPSRCYVTYLLRHKYMPSIVGAGAGSRRLSRAWHSNRQASPISDSCQRRGTHVNHLRNGGGVTLWVLEDRYNSLTMGRFRFC